MTKTEAWLFFTQFRTTVRIWLRERDQKHWDLQYFISKYINKGYTDALNQFDDVADWHCPLINTRYNRIMVESGQSYAVCQSVKSSHDSVEFPGFTWWVKCCFWGFDTIRRLIFGTKCKNTKGIFRLCNSNNRVSLLYVTLCEMPAIKSCQTARYQFNAVRLCTLCKTRSTMV